MAGCCFGMTQEEDQALLLGRGGDGFFWLFFIFTPFFVLTLGNIPVASPHTHITSRAVSNIL